MNRPNEITEYDELDLKLGIKSSLPHVKSTVALAILIWECAGRPSALTYSIQEDKEIVLAPETERAIINRLAGICAAEQIDSAELINEINRNQLFKSQMESLMVAFELVWKIAKISFVDKTKSASAERTGGIRYPKQLAYSVNMDIIHSAICANEEEYFKVLLSWIGMQVSYGAEYENALLHMLTALSESAIFKLADDERDVIFCQNGIYQRLLENPDAVNIDDAKEARGSLRILKSLLSDGMNPYLQGSGRNVTVNPAEDLINYQARVDTFLRLSSTKVINKEPEQNFDDQKTRFRNWMEGQVKPEDDSDAGQPYSKNTIDQYVSNLDNTFLPDGGSLFSTSDIEVVKQCAADLEMDERKNKTQRSAVQKYILFLQETACAAQRPVFNTGYKSPFGFAYNRILFGAPGTGKSFTINKERKELLGEDNETDYERVTFHPDYSYANFVGTYKPVPCKDSEGKDSITYKYVPGPFMRVYVNALKNGMAGSPKPFLLIIEEINRANAAAVFGDIFQLLDRDDDNISEYPIQASEDIKKHLASELGGSPDNYSKIRIPDNMFIWATMNSADQGVFPMDTAFKRRWDFTYLGINDNEKELIGKTVVLGSGDTIHRVEWNKLRKAINNFLAKEKINEDKQLGPYFIARKVAVPLDGDEIDREKFIRIFKDKVIMYLFEDAAKQKRSRLFEGCFDNSNRYSEICMEFDEKGIGIFQHNIQIEADPENLSSKTKNTNE